MNVIGHNHEGVQEIVPEDLGIVTNRLDDHVRDWRSAQVERSAGGFIQQSIHGGKCFARVKRVGWEHSAPGKTIVKTPRQENGLANLI